MAPVQHPSTAAARRGVDRRTTVALVVFLVWTTFVWVGRIRNALGDPDLTSSERVTTMLLACSFVVPAIVLAVAVVVARRRGSQIPVVVRAAVVLLAAWTTVVWVLRAADIALAGDHAAAFVAVHSVLAAISIGLAAWVTVRLLVRSPAATGASLADRVGDAR